MCTTGKDQRLTFRRLLVFHACLESRSPWHVWPVGVCEGADGLDGLRLSRCGGRLSPFMFAVVVKMSFSSVIDFSNLGFCGIPTMLGAV